MADMTVAFETDNLRVFEVGVTPSEVVGRRVIYMAFLRAGGASHAVAHATLCFRKDNPDCPFEFYCEWLEVAPQYRRKGYAMELLLGIEENELDGKQMQAIACSPEGEALLAKLGRPKDSLAPVVEQMESLFASPAVQARCDQEQRMLHSASLGENDSLQLVDQLMKIAPLSTMRATLNNTSLAPSERIRALGFLKAVADGGQIHTSDG